MPMEFDFKAMQAEIADLEPARNSKKLVFPEEAVELLVKAWDSGKKRSEIVKWWARFGFQGTEDTLRRAVQDYKERKQ